MTGKVRDDNPIRWQEYVTKQMDDVVNCPNCALIYKSIQPLCQEGDYPEILFCPHCDLELRVQIRYFSDEKLR